MPLDINPEFKQKAIQAILAVPHGKVSTYGAIAKEAGNTKGAREVAEILHLESDIYNLPWHRIISKDGHIAFNNEDQKKRQKRLLEKEGVLFVDDTIDLQKYMFNAKQKGLDAFFK